jgi:glycosyltransferase involved in cell wall biosynthesis
MRIGLNLLHALPEIGGGWNYIGSLLAALGDCDDGNTYVAFVTRESAELVPHKHNFRTRCVNIRSKSRFQRVWYENTSLQMLARECRVDCMHWFANTQAFFNAVPSLVTVYDLQAFMGDVHWSWSKRIYLRTAIAFTARTARVLLPMSQFTAESLRRVLGADPTHMVVIPPVMKAEFRPASTEKVAAFRTRRSLPDQFWTYVAHFYPHKNHRNLFLALSNLKETGFPVWPLVLRGDPHGSEREIHQTLRELQLQSRVILLPRLEADELPLLYSAASALIFPSLYEGGGIPVVEAMACGCPVVASDIPAVREYAGECAIYFDPTNPNSIATRIVRFQESADKTLRRSRESLPGVERFRAEVVASKLVNAYSRAVGS